MPATPHHAQALRGQLQGLQGLRTGRRQDDLVRTFLFYKDCLFLQVERATHHITLSQRIIATPKQKLIKKQIGVLS